MAKNEIKTEEEPLEKQLWKAADKLRKNIALPRVVYVSSHPSSIIARFNIINICVIIAYKCFYACNHLELKNKVKLN
jgi:hypothetical protein